MDFRPVEEGEDRSDSEGSHSEEAKELERMQVREGVKTEGTAAGKRGSPAIPCLFLPCPGVTK